MAQTSTRKPGVKQPADRARKDADRLDDETADEFVVEFDNTDFVIPNIAHGRPWRETAGMLASLSGERGVLAMQTSLEELLGEQVEVTDDWDFTKLMQFAYKLGERLGEAIGTPGK